MIWPVGYSSPTDPALSVQSIPPITVPRASGMATGRYARASRQETRNQAHHSPAGIGNDARSAARRPAHLAPAEPRPQAQRGAP